MNVDMLLGDLPAQHRERVLRVLQNQSALSQLARAPPPDYSFGAVGAPCELPLLKTTTADVGAVAGALGAGVQRPGEAISSQMAALFLTEQLAKPRQVPLLAVHTKVTSPFISVF